MRRDYGTSKWFVDRNYMSASVNLYLQQISAGGSMYIGEPAELVLTHLPREKENFIREPTLTLPDREAQQLFQAMWDSGMRPEGTVITDQTLNAQAKHIEFAERMADQLMEKIGGVRR